ncbi:solute carrier family 23 member 2-like [Babylonia areolata]|uniref:solute carrier family 23 member 2-like n=1 Tax=Babylonia areolata TaxID=304850 RepID=UPI003FCF9BAF
MSSSKQQRTPAMNGGQGEEEERKTKDVNVTVSDVVIENELQDASTVIYHVHDVPPVFMWPVYGMQQAFMCVSGALAVPFLMSSYICAGHLPEVRAQLLSITFFMCGVSTLLQTIIGIRLPIIQGASYAFLPPIVAMMKLDAWKCPPADQELGPDEEEPWKIRIREITGNLLVASLTQVVLGGTGMVGLLLRFIGPVTIAPTIALIGMGFTSAVTDFAEKQWGVAALTAALVLLFSLWMGRLQVPVPSYSKERGCHTTRFPIFVVISVLLAVGVGWLFCYILTVTDALPSNSTEPAYRARTDINTGVVDTAPWFKFPYPFMFGTPTVSLAGFFGMFLATISSVLESMGDYYACARVSKAPSPPAHAVNRGIAIEGLGSIISGLVGAGHATTSYSGNVASIAVTRVASRRVFQVAGLMLVLLGVLTKFGAVMTLIPDPIIGGLNAVLLGTLIAVGASTLHFVRMDLPRNVTIIGLTFMLGLALPQWVNADTGRINTGNDEVDQILLVLLGTPMFVGGLLGALLDNLVPGTLEERGITKWQQSVTSDPDTAEADIQNEVALTYDLPYVSEALRRIRCCTFVPFLPSFRGCWKRGPQEARAAGVGGRQK